MQYVQPLRASKASDCALARPAERAAHIFECGDAPALAREDDESVRRAKLVPELRSLGRAALVLYQQSLRRVAHPAPLRVLYELRHSAAEQVVCAQGLILYRVLYHCSAIGNKASIG